jgi:hypothetical protein
MEFSRKDIDALIYAKDLLEHPRLAAKITNLLGIPLEKGFKLLPARWSESVQDAARVSIRKALDLAVKTLGEEPSRPSSDFIHKMIVAANGAAAGALGMPALLIELPLSTAIMLRSIADVARSEGESIREMGTRLACLEVFALGGSSSADDATKAGYFAVRVALARTVAEAANYIAERGIVEEGAPALVRLISTIAARFGAVVSEKVAAQAIPVIGAVGGALINTVFIDHFQDMARGHFIVRRLERTYGPEMVRRQYDLL